MPPGIAYAADCGTTAGSRGSPLGVLYASLKPLLSYAETPLKGCWGVCRATCARDAEAVRFTMLSLILWRDSSAIFATASFRRPPDP
jgi:hypothetical protein